MHCRPRTTHIRRGVRRVKHEHLVVDWRQNVANVVGAHRRDGVGGLAWRAGQTTIPLERLGGIDWRKQRHLLRVQGADAHRYLNRRLGHTATKDTRREQHDTCHVTSAPAARRAARAPRSGRTPGQKSGGGGAPRLGELRDVLRMRSEKKRERAIIKRTVDNGLHSKICVPTAQ